MPSIAAIATRRAHAVLRLDALTKRLADEYGAEMPPPVPHVGQAELRQTLEVERLCALIESILDLTDAKVAEGTGGVDPAALDGSIADVKVYLESIEDEASLDMLAATESARERPRAGVLAAIDKRRSGLSSETEEE